MSEHQLLLCPHCGAAVVSNQVRCGWFRHGVYKKSFRPVNPHMSEAQAQRLVRQGKIYGCGQRWHVREPSQGDELTPRPIPP